MSLFLYGLVMLAGGALLGMTVLRDYFDHRFARPQPVTRLPIARLLVRVEDRRLDIPTVTRRRSRATIIDV